MLIAWIIVFIAALFALVKGADWLLSSAEKIGLAFGLSPFIIGVLIVGVGTSFPELISSMAAVLKDVTEIVPANAIGSNIANILLVIGISAIVGRRLVVTKSLIDLDLPLLAISTVLFLGIVWDKQVTLLEAILLLAAYGIYLLYSAIHKDDANEPDEREFLPSRADRRRKKLKEEKEKSKRPKLKTSDFGFLILGMIGLVLGAKYLIDAVIEISAILNIAMGVITLVAVAFGTSLPELIVSIKAAWQRKSEVALGNIFGSNVFNLLVVVGFPGLFKTLHLDSQTFLLAVPVLIVATLLFVISGISRRIHAWEGAMYLTIYLFFIGKLFNLF